MVPRMGYASFSAGRELQWGIALYTVNFTRPSKPITPVANTKLLLGAAKSGKVATGTGRSWNSDHFNPFSCNMTK